MLEAMKNNKQAQANETDEPVRIDLWLWASRWFKTRSLAKEAVSGGKVKLNGSTAKPAKPVHVGDKLIISKAAYRYDITVTGLVSKRVGAAIAAALYEESPQSIEKREQQQALQRLSRPLQTDARPDARTRGRIRAFKRKD